MEKEEFNFKQLFNEFLEIEKRYNLFEKKRTKCLLLEDIALSCFSRDQ